MSYIYKYSLVVLFALCSFNLVAQDDSNANSDTDTEETPARPKEYYLLSPRVSVTVPHPIANKSFKKSFVGIYEISGGLNFMLYKGLFAGLTYKNGLLKITENKISDFNASMYINNAGIKIGSDAYVGDKNRVIFSGAISAGQNWTRYSGLVSKDPNKHPLITSYTASYIEPEVNIFFLVENNFGIGATLSYSMFNKTFDPYELCLNDYAQFDKTNTGLTQYLSFGFGFYYGLVKRKK